MSPKSPFRLSNALARAAAIALVAALAGMPALAQPAPEEDTTEIVRTRYLESRELPSILSMLGVGYRMLNDGTTIILHGTPAEIAAGKDVIAALDVPPPQQTVELKVYILAAAKEADVGDGVPTALDPVTRQLGELFGYSSFGLLDTLYLKVRNGRPGQVTGGAEIGGHDVPYRFGFNRVEVTEEDDRQQVRFRGLSFRSGYWSEGALATYRSAVETDVDINEGQKAVVGKATPQGADQTLILVLEATVE